MMKFVVLASLIASVVSFHIPAPKKAPVSKTALFAENGTSSPKKIIVLGGDGFCGWPTSLYLSDRGHDVVIVDNLSRRKIDLDLGCDSLTPIQSPEVRQGEARCRRMPKWQFVRCAVESSWVVCIALEFCRLVAKRGRKCRARR